jgi:hypothetical protein
MSDTNDLNQRPKIIPKKVEPAARGRDAEAVAQAMAAAAPQPADTQRPPADVGEHPPAPEAPPPRPDIHPADLRAMEEDRRATAEELAGHIEAFGPGFVRRPFAERQMKLSAPRRPGFHRHWFNDEPGRIAHMKERGYKVVTENGKPITRTVGVSARGEGQTGYLMEIPLQWYEEDQRLSQKAADEIEATIRRGEMAVGDGRNRYVPRDGVDMRVERQNSPLVPGG